MAGMEQQDVGMGNPLGGEGQQPVYQQPDG